MIFYFWLQNEANEINMLHRLLLFILQL